MALGPIVLDATGEAYNQDAHIESIIWEGATSSGDTVTLRRNSDNALLWVGRTDSTQTYLGISFGGPGLSSPGGFTLTNRSSGQVIIYLR